MRLRTADDLREDQRTIFNEIVRNHARLIVSAMGSGKTGATALAFRKLLTMGKIRRVLIIAPKFVARNTWPDEFKAWAETLDLDYEVCVGTEAERIAVLAKKSTVTIVNKDVLPWLAQYLKSVDNWPWDCVIVDESSMFKAGKKRTTRARVKAKIGERWAVFAPWNDQEPLHYSEVLEERADRKTWCAEIVSFWAEMGVAVEAKKHRDVIGVKVRKGGNMTRFGVLTAARKKIKHIVLLTGTPAPNGVEDLWGQIYLLDQGERLGRNMTNFHDRWFKKNQYTHEIKPKPGAEKEILSLVKDVMISIPPRKLVDAPVFVPVRVSLPPKVMEQYREFEATAFSEPYDVEAVSQGVLVNKLLQFSNGSMFRSDGSIVPVHTEKLDALDELLERAAGDPMLIFYSYRFDLDAIRKRHPDAVVANECDDFIDRWNKGKIKKLLAHPASIGHGTNLQFGGHLSCWFGLPWSLELYQQANARLARPGQTNQVAIYEIVAEHTYDMEQAESLRKKGITQDEIIAGVCKKLIPDFC